MSKQSLLLVDGDTRSLRVLEVSLRKAGFMVTAAMSVQDALDKLELHAPDLIISETTFPDGDGFELRRRVRATPEWSEIPFIFLTAEAAIENKIRGLELGVDDYLTKPIYIKEIVTRINILLQKRQRIRFEERRDGRTRFAGRVQDMPVVDVIQTIEISRKSGVIQFVGERGRQAAIYFRDGRVIDAEAGSLLGEDAVYRLLTWSEGEFEVVFRTVRRREVITMSSQALLMEGMRRLDEWSRLFEQLPPLTHRFEVDTVELAARLGDVPDDNNRILRLVDGKRTLLEVIDASDVGDLECLQAISRLYFEELLIDLDHGNAPRRDTGSKAVALVEIDAPSPVTDETSGPVNGEAAAAAAAASAGEAVRDEAEGAGDALASETTEPATDDALPAHAAVDDHDASIGPLTGGYRPSSLRLIDEAVAAAQAIEPTLFDDSRADEPQPPRQGHSGNGVSRPVPVEHDDEHGDGPADGTDDMPAGILAGENLRAAEREDSGLRMIGSLGRDRAEASGELATFGQTRPLRSETARELVTILPRRITRELPIIAQELAESLPTPTPTASVLVARTVPALDLSAPASQSQRIVLPGSGVTAPSRSRKLLRVMRSMDGTGPGLVAMLLIVLAVVLAGTAALLRLRRHGTPAQVAPPYELIHDGAPGERSVGTTGPPARTGALEHRRDGAGGRPGERTDWSQDTVPRDADSAARHAELSRWLTNDPAEIARLNARAAERNAATPGGARPSGRGTGDPATPGGDAGRPNARSDRNAAKTGGADGGRPNARLDQNGATGAATSGRGDAKTASGDIGRSTARADQNGVAGSAPSGRGAGDASRQSPRADQSGAAGSAPSGRGDARTGSGDAGRSNARAEQNGAAGSAPSGRGDAKAAGGDAGRANTRTAAADRNAEAKSLCDAAENALAEGDSTRAFELAVSSIKLRRTARAYVLRARAEQRLSRVDDALSSLDAATEIAPTAGTVWEQRGRILWAARRRDEARAAFTRFLELSPNAASAPEILRLLNEPR